MLLTKYYEDPSVLHVGTMPDRAYYECYGENGQKDCMMLNGIWKFQYYSEVYEVPDSFGDKAFDDGSFNEIPVPGCWQNHGYGQHQYLCNFYPYSYIPPYVPHENPCGAYRTVFQVEADNLEKKAYLNFDGVDSCFYVWLNGTFIGYSQVAHGTSEFDVSRYLQKGNNQLAVLVFQWSDGSYLECQDKFRMSGIFRDVYIQFRPQNHIRDFFVKTELSEDYKKAKIDIELEFLKGLMDVQYSLYNQEGDILCSAVIERGQETITVNNPVLWNAEQPYSYILCLETEAEEIRQRVAVREIKVKNAVVYLNGAPIKIKGVNRHDSDPIVGYAVDYDHVIRDLKLMKEHNINAIRASHYPNAPWFPDLCTKYGFYLIAEADLEAHGAANIYEGACSKTFGDLIQREIFDEAVLDRVKKCVIRDKNHGSIIMWSLGNESGFSKSLETAGRWVREYDNSRLVHYESSIWETGNHKNDVSMLDVYSKMYDSIEKIDEYFAQGEVEKPYMLCEYAHSMGNSPGGLEDYANKFYSEPRILGAFVWEWCDHAVYMGKADNGKKKYYYGGDFKEKLHNDNFCLDGLVYPDRTPHTGLKEYKNVIRPIRARMEGQSILLENMLDFLDAAETFDIVCEVLKNGESIRSKNIVLESMKPHETCEIPLMEIPQEQGVYHVKISYYYRNAGEFIAQGDCAGFDELCMKDDYQIAERQYKGNLSDIAVAEDEKYVYLKGSNFNYVYNKHTGSFSNLYYNGQEYLNTPILYNIWRAPTDNDCQVKKKWEAAGYPSALNHGLHTNVAREKECITITTSSLLAAPHVQTIAEINSTWEVEKNGRIKVKIELQKNEIMPDFPRFGLRFFLQKPLEYVTYQGYGPYESYSDKHQASYYGRFDSTVEHMHEDYIKPQENGSHFHSNYLMLSDRKNKKVEIQSQRPFSFQTSYYTQEELAGKKHNYELEPAAQVIVCVDYKMGGIGTNSCGPEPDLIYQITEPKIEFEFVIDIGGEE
ncbi:glycoside hydrolase family 2 [Clostridiales bacterium TF09-2AC]|uniref:beta-galactosidase n=1 Tax=Enterocloster hominis (ex Hitch et al. 2024) TaxID=1917870 RepID=A0ABV1D4N9_9FIRM|nr:Beta galactosidase small chain [Clostridiales bacterium 1_7_47FAA]RJW48940.1 glycoside hydrolase family 2 [Clostridiales bacterium TF09-2AC]